MSNIAFKQPVLCALNLGVGRGIFYVQCVLLASLSRSVLADDCPVSQPLRAHFTAVTILVLGIWETELSSQPVLPSGTQSTMLLWERPAVAFSAVCAIK